MQSLTLALVLAMATGTVQAQSYRFSVAVIDPLPGHAFVSTSAINNHGVVVGVSYGSPIDNQAPYIWTATAGTQPLPLPAGYAVSIPTDINDTGVIVGYALPVWSAEQSMAAWKYEAGQFTVYPGVAYANNINNAGTIVGRSCLSGSQLTCYFKAEPGQPALSIAPANFYSSSQWRFIDVNDGGQIVYTPPSAAGAATRREPDGSLTSLPAPPLPYVRTYTWAINNSGQVAARYEYNIGSQYFSRAFIWDLASGAQTIGVPNNHVRVKGLNDLGHVVGESGGNENSYLDMWLWTPQRGSEDLDPLIDPALQIVMTGVSGINDAGQIIGRGISQLPPAPSVQFVLTPVAANCYANCDSSTTPPILNVQDFSCFLNRFASGNPWANCDNSTTAPTLNIQDFSCFLNTFAAGCS